jgi:hypothetical protein
MFSPRRTRENGTCFDQLVLRQAVEVRKRADEPAVPKQPDRLLADALDVGDPHPVDQGLEPTRGAGPVRAPVHNLAFGLDDVRAAKRALLRHPKALRPRLVLARGTDDLRNHVPSPLDDDDVSFADLLPVDVLLVVEGRP